VRNREISSRLWPSGVRHHGHLDAHGVQPGDALCPVSFDCGLTFKLEPELAKELNRRSEVLDDNAYIVHPLKSASINACSAATSNSLPGRSLTWRMNRLEPSSRPAGSSRDAPW